MNKEHSLRQLHNYCSLLGEDGVDHKEIGRLIRKWIYTNIVPIQTRIGITFEARNWAADKFEDMKNHYRNKISCEMGKELLKYTLSDETVLLGSGDTIIHYEALVVRNNAR